MDRHDIIAFAACAIALASTAYYLVTVVRGTTRPSRSSYWIWSGLGTLMTASYLVSGAGNWYLSAVNAAAAAMVACFSLRYGEGNELNAWDRRCIRMAVLSVPLWVVLHAFVSGPVAAMLAFCVQMLADAIGGIPVFEKAWNRPESEDRRAWVASVLSYALNLFAVRQWTVQDLVWNGWIGGACAAVTLMLFLRPRSDAAALET